MNVLSKNSSKLLLSLSLLWAGLLLLIGAWWVYFMVNIERFLVENKTNKISTMLAWEGGTFIILLLLLSVSIFILYLKDTKKTKSLQAFFASLTHELKTPLASIKLQSEVIHDILEKNNDQKLNKLFERLINDTVKLEIQMDKILQLSRLERGGELNTSSISILQKVNKLSKSWNQFFNVTIQGQTDQLFIEADDFALELIIKNMFENTKNHAQTKNVTIDFKVTDNHIELIYKDEGTFTGDVDKLGTLFYKHNSTKGSGIGLYLSKLLMEKMGGKLNIRHLSGQTLEFSFLFKKSEDQHA